MFELLRAEGIKLLRHRATWFLVWIFPIGISALLAAGTVYQMIKGQAPDQGPPTTAVGWISNTTFPWAIASNPIGRYLLAAFTAVAFGGEYGWNTWKLVAPHKSRAALMTAKYTTVLALIAVSLVLAAVLGTAGLWADALLTGDPVPAGVQVTALIAAQGRAALAAAFVVVLTVAYASAGATLTRSTIAGLVIAIVAITAESLIVQLGPRFMHPTLYQALPSHHLANLENWITEGKAVVRKFPGGAEVNLHWGWSLGSLAVWAGGLIALTVGAFRRQDLN